MWAEPLERGFWTRVFDTKTTELRFFFYIHKSLQYTYLLHYIQITLQYYWNDTEGSKNYVNPQAINIDANYNT